MSEDSLLNNLKSFLIGFYSNVTAGTLMEQICIGCATGCYAGYTFCKISKTAAFCFGASVLILQLLMLHGYFSIGESQTERIRHQIDQQTKTTFAWIKEQSTLHFQRNTMFTISFAGGCLIGLGMSWLLKTTSFSFVKW